jgi:hypothetical protein
MQELVQSFLDLIEEVLFVIELAGNCLRLCHLAFIVCFGNEMSNLCFFS